MSVRLHVSVMHDRRREEVLPRLLDRLDAATATKLKERTGLDGWIIDGGVQTLTVADGTMAGPWAALRDGILMALRTTPNPTHVLLIEDYAEPVDGFLPAVVRAVEAVPGQALYFFATKSQAGAEMDEAAERGEPFAPVTARTVGSLAVVLPIDLAGFFLADTTDAKWDYDFRRLFPCSPHAGDARLWHWLGQHGWAQWVSVWSLVEHGCPGYDQSISGADRPRAMTDADAADQAARRRAYRLRDWDVEGIEWGGEGGDQGTKGRRDQGTRSDA